MKFGLAMPPADLGKDLDAILKLFGFTRWKLNGSRRRRIHRRRGSGNKHYSEKGPRAKKMSGQGDCERLMNTVLPVADKMLKQFKEFYPYGAYMRPNGRIVEVGAAEHRTEHPKSKDLLDKLRSSFSKLAASNKCKATAIVFDVLLKSSDTHQHSNAIQICLEHSDGYSAEVFFPYETTDDGRVVYGETFAQEGGHDVFG
jgi:hypothetical protein